MFSFVFSGVMAFCMGTSGVFMVVPRAPTHRGKETPLKPTSSLPPSKALGTLW